MAFLVGSNPEIPMRRLPELLVLAVCLLSAATFLALPPVVVADASWLLPVATPAEAASRLFVAFGIPLVLVLVLAAFRWASSERGQASMTRVLPSWLGTPGGRAPEFEKFPAALDLITLCIIAIVAGMHLGFLASALGWRGPIASLVGLVFGGALISMGNVMPRLRPNPIAGLRTEALLRDPIAWRNAHANFGRVWVVGGTLVLVVALIAPRYSLVAFVAVVLLSTIVAPIFTRRALGAQHADVKR
jgi:SdpI/YfhL protein family